MAEKKKRGSLSLERRIQVIKESEKGTSHRNLALQFNCGKTQIATILLQKEELLREWETVGKKDCFLKRKTPIGRVYNKLVWPDATTKKLGRQKEKVNDLSWPAAKINNLMWAWLRDANARCIPISGPIIKAKATEYAQGLNISSFNANDEWLDSFRKRHNIISLTAYGGSGSLDSNIVVEWNIQALPTVEEYDPRNIYNVDETGLFFREIPGETLFKKVSDCNEGKYAKERFTICLCCNAVGEKEPLLVVSNSLQSKLFNSSDISSGIQWRENKRAWMSPSIFQEWLLHLNEKMAQQNRKIILFMDRATCHPTNISLTNIELQFISADCPIFLQPLEEGITHSFKVLYRKKLMRNILARMLDHEQVTLKNLNLTSVIKWMNAAWSEVKPETISKCFMMCGIAGKMSHVNIMWETREDAELNELCKAAGIYETIFDEKIPCYKEVDDDWNQNVEETIFNSSSGPVTLGLNGSEEFEEEHGENVVVPYSLHDSLTAIDRLKAMFTNMNSEGAYSYVFDSLEYIEQTIEEIIIKDKINCFNTSLM